MGSAQAACKIVPFCLTSRGFQEHLGIGCGYLGPVHAASLAQLGHDVVGIEVGVAKAELLATVRTPFHEPGLEGLLRASLASGRLRFSPDIVQAERSPVHVVCVGTPQKRGEYAADLRVRGARNRAAAGSAVTGKVAGALLAWNAEILREGFAVQDAAGRGVRADRG